MKENEKGQKGKMNNPGQKSHEQNKGDRSQKSNSPLQTVDSDKWNNNELDDENESDFEKTNGNKMGNSKRKNSQDGY